MIILSGFTVHGYINPKDNQSSHNYCAPSSFSTCQAAFAGHKKLIYSVNSHPNFCGLPLVKRIHPHGEYFALPGSCPDGNHNLSQKCLFSSPKSAVFHPLHCKKTQIISCKKTYNPPTAMHNTCLVWAF